MNKIDLVLKTQQELANYQHLTTWTARGSMGKQGRVWIVNTGLNMEGCIDFDAIPALIKHLEFLIKE